MLSGWIPSRHRIWRLYFLLGPTINENGQFIREWVSELVVVSSKTLATTSCSRHKFICLCQSHARASIDFLTIERRHARHLRLAATLLLHYYYYHYFYVVLVPVRHSGFANLMALFLQLEVPVLLSIKHPSSTATVHHYYCYYNKNHLWCCWTLSLPMLRVML
jgi:hypothetical protein